MSVKAGVTLALRAVFSVDADVTDPTWKPADCIIVLASACVVPSETVGFDPFLTPTAITRL